MSIWNADGSGEPLVLKGHEAGVTSVAFSSDGNRVVTGSEDKTARIWKANAYGEALVLRGHKDKVTSVAFSPDAKPSSPVAGTRPRASGMQTAPVNRLYLEVPRYGVTSVAFSPDGKRVITGGADTTARIWIVDHDLRLKRYGTRPASACPNAAARNSLENLPPMPSRVIRAVELRSPDAVAGPVLAVDVGDRGAGSWPPVRELSAPIDPGRRTNAVQTLFIKHDLDIGMIQGLELVKQIQSGLAEAFNFLKLNRDPTSSDT